MPTAALAAPLFAARTDYGTGSFSFSVAIGDLNGDWKPDLAVANGGSNSVSVLLGNGDGTFGMKTDFGTGTNPNAVAIGDLNGDRRLDLVAANRNANTVSVLLGTGTGTFGAKTDYGTGNNPYSVAIGDLNGDARRDLAVANNASNTVSVLLNTGAGTADVPAAPPVAFTLDPVRPNPWQEGALTVRFTLPLSAPARLELLDIAGRRIASHEVGADQHTLDLRAGRPLVAGLYLVRLTQGMNTRTTRVVVLR